MINYDEMCQKALKRVLRDLLTIPRYDPDKFPIELSIVFDTCHLDVRIPSVLRSQYPQRMTITIYQNFFNLSVEEHGFSVTLDFAGVYHSIYVPYDAVLGISDQENGFMLLFVSEDGEDDLTEASQELSSAAAAPSSPSAAALSASALPHQNPASKIIDISKYKRK